VEADFAHFYPDIDLATVSWRRFRNCLGALQSREGSAFALLQEHGTASPGDGWTPGGHLNQEEGAELFKSLT